MNAELFQSSVNPEDIAISKTSPPVGGHTFFLDFNKPLESWKRFNLIPMAWFVPVIHESESEDGAGYIVGVHRFDPNYKTIKTLWAERYPSPRRKPTGNSEGLVIAADFAFHFPPDSQYVPDAIP